MRIYSNLKRKIDFLETYKTCLYAHAKKNGYTGCYRKNTLIILIKIKKNTVTVYICDVCIADEHFRSVNN